MRSSSLFRELPGRTILWILLIMFAIVVIVFLFGGNGLWNTFTLDKRVASLEAKVDSLENMNQKMAVRIEGLTKENLNVIEEEARDHGLIKPGEKVYLMRSEKGDSR